MIFVNNLTNHLMTVYIIIVCFIYINVLAGK